MKELRWDKLKDIEEPVDICVTHKEALKKVTMWKYPWPQIEHGKRSQNEVFIPYYEIRKIKD